MSDRKNEDAVPLLAVAHAQEQNQQQKTHIDKVKSTKRAIVLASFGLIFMLYTALSSLRNGSLARFGCHRGMGSAVTLPAHFKLPSGDRIPAVALGTFTSNVSGLCMFFLKMISYGRRMAGLEGRSGRSCQGELVKSASREETS